jgi:hypothetical protein
MIVKPYRKTLRAVVFLSLALGLVVTGALAGLASVGAPRPHLAGRPDVPRVLPLPARLAAIDEALARNDTGRAIREWRDAYGVALGTRRWDAMAAVGDAAVRIDTRVARPPGGYTGFRAEARQAYLLALFRARDTRSPEGIARVADAFAALGDDEMAARARTIVVTP